MPPTSGGRCRSTPKHVVTFSCELLHYWHTVWVVFSSFSQCCLRLQVATLLVVLFFSRTCVDSLVKMEDEAGVVLVTGAAGLLGTHMLRSCPPHIVLHGTIRNTVPFIDETSRIALHPCELTEPGAFRDLLQRVRPAVVIHTAYSIKDLDRDVRCATYSVVDACRDVGVPLMAMSSDVVLNGDDGLAPYADDAPCCPVSEYGQAKADCEAYMVKSLSREGCVIVRTSLIVSTHPLSANCRWIADRLHAHDTVTAFVDELRAPIAAEDLALMLWELAVLFVPRCTPSGGSDVRAGPSCAFRGEYGGVWNIVGPETISRYTLALLVAQCCGFDARGTIKGALSKDSSVKRPRDLRMTMQRAQKFLHTTPRPIGELFWRHTSLP